MKKTLLFSAMTGIASSALAQSVLLSDNFDGMVLGSNPLAQLVQVDNTGTSAAWTNFGTSATPVVSNLQAVSGTQSILVDRIATTGFTFIYPPLNFDGVSELGHPWTPAIGAYEASVDVRFSNLSQNTGVIGIDCFVPQGRFARLLVSATGATQANVLFLFPGTSGLTNFVPPQTFDRSNWINLRVRQEMLTGTSAIISYFVNGVPIGDGLLQARYTINNAPGMGPSDFDFAMGNFLTTTVTSSVFFGLPLPSLTDDYFFDNFRVVTEGPLQQITIPLNLQGTEATWVPSRTLRYRLLDGANNPIHGFYGIVANEGTETIVVNVPNQVTGTVTIEVDGGQFLKRRIPVTLTGGNQTLGAQTVFNGDVDNNGEVDLTDIDLIIGAYLTAGGTTEGTITDLDNNGEVDLTDIDIAIGNYLLGDDV